MTDLAKLIAERDSIARQINEARAVERANAISQIRRLMTEHGLSVADLVSEKPSRSGGSQPGTKVKPKFRDPHSGATWTGRGLKPKWLTAALESGRSIDEFAINAS